MATLIVALVVGGCALRWGMSRMRAILTGIGSGLLFLVILSFVSNVLTGS